MELIVVRRDPRRWIIARRADGGRWDEVVLRGTGACLGNELVIRLFMGSIFCNVKSSRCEDQDRVSACVDILDIDVAGRGYSGGGTAPSAVLLILGSPANPSKLICWLVLTTGTNTYNPALCKALDAIYRHLTVKISTTPIRIQSLPDTCSNVKEHETRVLTCMQDHSQ